MDRFHVITFGCQMNVHDSSRIAEVLTLAGYSSADAVDAAEIVVLNTCSVRDKAEHKLRSEVGRLALRKGRGGPRTIVVAGCVAQQEGERLLRAAPEIDLVIGPDNIGELPGLLAELNLGGLPKAYTRFDLDDPKFLPIQVQLDAALAATFVTIMKGCDERCSFCIVPYTRGKERYRPSRDILDEIERLVAHGTQEVTLLGQTVNSYQDPTHELMATPSVALDIGQGAHPTASDESEFPELLRAIAARVPGLKRLRYVSPHPRHVTRSLIAAHRELPTLCRHLHLPVQSGSNRLLKRMIRRYTVEDYEQRVAALRCAVPGLTISTDVIVGFPGETRTDFEATLDLVRRLGFVGVFAFKYSERPGTPSLRLGDDVSEDEKSRRLSELLALVDTQRQAYLQSLVGSRQWVLIESRKPDGGWTGRTERNEIAHLACTEMIQGQLLEVVVRQALKNSLAVEALDPKLALPVTQLPRLRPRDGQFSDLARPVSLPQVSGERRSLPVV